MPVQSFHVKDGRKDIAKRSQRNKSGKTAASYKAGMGPAVRIKGLC